MDSYAYRMPDRQAGTFAGDFIVGWKPLYRNEFEGDSEDSSLREGVHRFESSRLGEETATVAAARKLLASSDVESRARINHPVDAIEWQTWANLEFMQFEPGRFINPDRNYWPTNRKAPTKGRGNL